jgi:putative ABC transport system permease protein
MTLWHRIRSWVDATVRRSRMESEMDTELRFHLEASAENLERIGVSHQEAMRRARLDFGGVERVKEEGREARGVRHFESLMQDIRYGLRMLGKGPGFTSVAVLTLALGIGANTAIFSVVNAILLSELPFKDAHRLVAIREIDTKSRATISPISSADFMDWKEQTHVFEQIAAWRFLYFNLAGRDEPERVQGLTVSASFLPLLGAQAQLGRVFLSEEEQAGHDKVAVLSDALWRRRFGGDSNLVGQRIDIEGEAYLVVGVLSPTFRIFRVLNRPLDIYVPLTFDRSRLNRQDRDTFVYARLKPGVSIDQAQSEMDALYGTLGEKYPSTNSTRGARVVSLLESFAGDIRPTLLLLLGAVGFVLLIACANVANLVLARAMNRQREMAVRAAVGASPSRLLRQALTENLLLALLGGAAGTLVAFGGVRILNDLISYQAVNRLHDFGLDARVLGFTLVISLLSGVVSGMAPALQFARLKDPLKETGRSLTGSPRARRMAGLLVTAEVALAAALLCCAALLIRSASLLQGIPRGLNPHNVLTMQVWLPRAKYSDGHQVATFYRQILERIEKLPGVESASAINFPPLALQYTSVRFTIEGHSPQPPEDAFVARCSVISPEYFRTMNIPLLFGRAFTDHDADETHGVVIISASMARRFWPDADPIGYQIRPQFSQQKYFWIPESKNLPLRIVGVAGDVRNDGLADNDLPQFYLPQLQNPSSLMHLAVRTAADPLRWAEAVRSQVWAVDKDQPLFDVKRMEDILGESFARPHLLASLLGTFAAVALLLAGVGIYGLISYAVSQRTQEMGIRMAMGAQSGDALRLVLRQGMGLTLAGLVVGLFAALATAGLLRNFLFGVQPADPASFASVVLLLAGVALLACYIPARRAMRVDPMVALRYE